MLKRFIFFLIRRRLGLKKFEKFQFANQRNTEEYYYFSSTMLHKFNTHHNVHGIIPSHVSLNWILDDKCEIVSLDRRRYSKKKKQK